MIWPIPQTIKSDRLTIEPISHAHEAGLRAAVLDGELWKLTVTSAPEPDKVQDYIAMALQMQEQGTRVAHVVVENDTGRLLGSTSYHDIIANIKRVEIGYTWYAKSVQKSYVNTLCKYMMLQHAFEELDCGVVGWRTDNLNFASQRAIERLGAKKDGTIRHHALRRDGTVRDTVLYSVLQHEWHSGIKTHLQQLMQRYPD